MKKEKRLLIGAIAAMAVVLCMGFGINYMNSNAKEDFDKQQTKVNQDINFEEVTGIKAVNEETVVYDDVILESKEYDIDSEEDKEKVKAYMKETVENDAAYAGE